jgi:hypothetical protein
MQMWKPYNPNPARRWVGDCTIRAIAKATGKTWDEVYTGVSLDGYLLSDMMSANHVWGAYLRRNGWKRKLVDEACPDCYTVADFASEHANGTYILALDGHVVTIKDGDWYDTWDSGNEIPIYYWYKE